MIDKTQEEIIATWNKYTNNPLVSICSLSYNHADYISQSIDGLLAQVTTFPFEIIIHDDCSTDGTTEIIKKYKDKYPKIIHAVFENENQYSKGFSNMLSSFVYPHCKGKYYALCEGDDYWTDCNKLQLQVGFLEKNSDYSMCFHDAEIIYDGGSPHIRFSYNTQEKDYTATELFKNWVVPTASMVFKKEIESYPIIDESKILNSDIFIVEKCAHMGKVYCFNKKMSVYRIQSNGLTWKKDLKKERVYKYPDHYKEIKNSFPLIKRQVVNDAICSAYLNIAVHYSRNPLNRIKWLLKGFLVSPGFIIHKVLHKIYAKLIKEN